MLTNGVILFIYRGNDIDIFFYFFSSPFFNLTFYRKNDFTTSVGFRLVTTYFLFSCFLRISALSF